MQRRAFLQLPALALPLASDSPAPDQARASSGVKVASGEDRFGQHSFKVEAATIDCKVSAKDTGGDMCVFEATRTGRGGPPLHVHQHQDEWFYIVEGEYALRVGEQTYLLRAGDSVFAPRGIPHTFAKVNEGAAKMILVYQPAGSMEDYFREVTRFTRPPTEAEMERLFKTHDMEVVGPPLAV
jgi:mannose-6-phosphate isomerase-like protein (cupin superfamily)